MASIVPIVAAAGIDAAGRLAKTALTAVEQSFQRLLDRGVGGGGESSVSSEGGAAAGGAPLSSAGRLAERQAARGVLKQRVERFIERLREVLQKGGLEWTRPIRIESRGGELRVRADGNRLPELMAARIEGDRQLGRAFEAMAQAAALPDGPFLLDVGPDGDWSIPGTQSSTSLRPGTRQSPLQQSPRQKGGQ